MNLKQIEKLQKECDEVWKSYNGKDLEFVLEIIRLLEEAEKALIWEYSTSTNEDTKELKVRMEVLREEAKKRFEVINRGSLSRKKKETQK